MLVDTSNAVNILNCHKLYSIIQTDAGMKQRHKYITDDEDNVDNKVNTVLSRILKDICQIKLPCRFNQLLGRTEWRYTGNRR